LLEDLCNLGRNITLGLEYLQRRQILVLEEVEVLFYGEVVTKELLERHHATVLEPSDESLKLFARHPIKQVLAVVVEVLVYKISHCLLLISNLYTIIACPPA